MLNENSKYIGQCDNIRNCRFNKNNVDFFKNIDTKKWWEDTLKNSSEISKKEFLLNVNPHEILDSDESFDDFLNNLSDTYNFYKTNNIYFIKTSGTNGFEWFWVKKDKLSINESLNKKFITVYHGTKPKFVSSIKQNGLIDKSGYNQGWYVVSTDFESALFHSHPDEDKGDTNVIEFKVPIKDNDKWLGYPYLWKGQKMNDNSTWFALMQKLPTEFITKIHTINYDTFMRQKNSGFSKINENTLNEENSDLKGTILKIVSPNIQKHLDDLIKQYGDKAEIIKHIVSAIDDKPEYSLTYEYAKKIKNYFDNFKGNNTSEEYQLHGGIKLKNYINLILAMKRDSISTGKDIRKNMTILNNTHLKSHDKSTIGLTRNPMALKEHIELIENYIPTKKASCGVILNPEKSILLVKRGVDTKWFPGKWALVGGKVDGDEEFKDAFVREVKEETNLDLDFIKYCFNKHDGDCEVALFVAITKTPNDIKINKEHSDYKWCTANEIKELDCVPHIYEDISECLKLLINNKEDLLAEEYKHSEYLSWKRKNVTIRGIKEAGQENNAGAMLGRGLYTAFLSNKELAKQYGTVKFVVNAIPKKPKVFNTLNEWEIFFYNTLIRNYCKEHGLKESRTNFSQNTTIEDEMQKLGFDGIIIKGREIVNYKPENVVYFSNENQLINYYDSVIKN